MSPRRPTVAPGPTRRRRGGSRRTSWGAGPSPGVELVALHDLEPLEREAGAPRHACLGVCRHLDRDAEPRGHEAVDARQPGAATGQGDAAAIEPTCERG